MTVRHATAPYVIITPAHNEEAFIERTIRSMIGQTVRPLRWVVVDDGSTDRTGQIAARYAEEHGFLRVVTVQRPAKRDFGNKVRAFNRGLREARGLDYRFVGNIDADISLERDYFERLLGEFGRDPELGLAGGMVSTSIGGGFVSQDVAPDSVAGAVQLFRRECFERIGGYLALPQGGIDAAAEIMARMQGWKVRTFPELAVLEHRRTGTALVNPLASRVREGLRLHSLGYGPLFMCMRCIYRSLDRPRVIGSAAALYGYVKGLVQGDPVVLSDDVVRFLRAEQRGKLLRLVVRGRKSGVAV